MSALGMIETVGMVAAVVAGDTAVKSANVTLVGYELTKGGAMVTIKIVGEVSAVKSAVEVASMEAEKVSRVVRKLVIPRPHDELEKLIIDHKIKGHVHNSNINNISFETVNESYPGNRKKDYSIEDSDPKITTSEEGQITEQLEVVEQKEITSVKEESDGDEICNICKDPTCTRRKGDLKVVCIHHKIKN